MPKPPNFRGVGESTVCNTCGSVVLSINDHTEFHMSLDRKREEMSQEIEALKRNVKLAAMGF